MQNRGGSDRGEERAATENGATPTPVGVTQNDILHWVGTELEKGHSCVVILPHEVRAVSFLVVHGHGSTLIDYHEETVTVRTEG